MDQGIFTTEPRYDYFLTSDPPDCVLDIVFGALPSIDGWEQIYDSGGLWRLYHNQTGWAITRHSADRPDRSYQTVLMNADFEKGTIYSLPNDWSDQLIPLPFYYPLPEIIAINLLARGRGIMIHACAVKYKGAGLMFAGHSGAGRSTTAELWKSIPDGTLLSDDRVIIRKVNGEFWIYGTPWHGDANVLSNEALPLSKVFLLRQSQWNEARRLRPVEAASQLLARGFPPFYDQSGVAFSLDFIAELTQSVPCYDLAFLPEPSMIDYVRSIEPEGIHKG